MASTDIFECKVMVNPFSSARLDFYPQPGILKVDNGFLTVTNTANDKALVQKPLTELTSVQFGAPEVARKLGNNTVLIYAGLNEAYAVSFGTGTSLDAGMEIYKDMLQGDFAAATEALNKSGRRQSGYSGNFIPKEEQKQAIANSVASREKFIELAKQAGVYTPYHRSLRGVALAAGIVVVLGAILYLFFAGGSK